MYVPDSDTCLITSHPGGSTRPLSRCVRHDAWVFYEACKRSCMQTSKQGHMHVQCRRELIMYAALLAWYAAPKDTASAPKDTRYFVRLTVTMPYSKVRQRVESKSLRLFCQLLDMIHEVTPRCICLSVCLCVCVSLSPCRPSSTRPSGTSTRRP